MFTPTASWYQWQSAVDRPHYRISSYSELDGALGYQVQPVVPRSGFDATRTTTDEPHEFARYTVGIFDSEEVNANGSNVSRRDACTTQRRSRHHPGGTDGCANQQLHQNYVTYGGSVNTGSHMPATGSEPNLTTRTSIKEELPRLTNDLPIELYSIDEAGNVYSQLLSEPEFDQLSHASRSPRHSSTPFSVLIDESEDSGPGTTIKSPQPNASMIKEERPAPLINSPLKEENSSSASESTRTVRKKRELRKNTTALACYFCRGRKIRCGGPNPKNEDRACRQCAHRKLECVFPIKSNRGRRPRKAVKNKTSVELASQPSTSLS